MKRDLKQMQRAYALIEGKAAVERTPGKFIIRGTATTPTPDRYGDIVEPMGARFKLPLALLWQHRAEQPVGTVTKAGALPSGIPFEAELPDIKEGNLGARIQEAIASVEAGLVRAVSIGFRPLPDGMEVLDPNTYAIRFTEWEWLELSLVTIPANSEATIEAAKAFFARDALVLPADVVRMDAAISRRVSLQSVVLI